MSRSRTVPATCILHLRDWSDPAIVRAATLRQKLHFKLAISPSHGIMTPDQPVPELALMASGRLGARIPICELLI